MTRITGFHSIILKFEYLTIKIVNIFEAVCCEFDTSLPETPEMVLDIVIIENEKSTNNIEHDNNTPNEPIENQKVSDDSIISVSIKHDINKSVDIKKPDIDKTPVNKLTGDPLFYY